MPSRTHVSPGCLSKLKNGMIQRGLGSRKSCGVTSHSVKTPSFLLLQEVKGPQLLPIRKPTLHQSPEFSHIPLAGSSKHSSLAPVQGKHTYPSKIPAVLLCTSSPHQVPRCLLPYPRVASEAPLCPGPCIYPLKPNGCSSLDRFLSVHSKKMVITSSTH